MTFKQFIVILRARWLIALGAFSVVAGGTLLISLLLPKTYSATASVVIDVKPDPIGGLLSSTAGLTPSILETQVDIIQSERVAARVVRTLDLANNPQVRAQWMETTRGQGDIELWLGETFQRSLEVRPTRASGVLNITYRSEDPKFAAVLANAFAKSYIETAVDLRVDPARQYTAFFDSRAKEARESVERAQAKLTQFQRNNGIIATDERLDVETARLNELSSQLVALQAQTSESAIRQRQAQTAASADKMQEVLSNPLIVALKSEQARQEARVQELGARYGDSHPQMQEARASLNDVKAKIDSETRRVLGSVGLTSNITRQRESELRVELEGQRAKLLRLKAVRDEGLVLQREAENAQRLYEQVVARLNQTSLESQTNQTNVTLLSDAKVPGKPTSPRVLLNTVLASVLGVALAIGIALGRESLDRRVRLPSDIVEALDLPIIGVVPKPASGLLAGRRASALQRRLLTTTGKLSKAT